jgi:hypothetical protein
VAQVVKCLISKCKALSSNPRERETGRQKERERENVFNLVNLIVELKWKNKDSRKIVARHQ